ncbi:MAG TPA: acetate--CoA ligase family protein [Candidatus Binatia bacterium]|jgi:acyl-CoA synthetase (NDP forming)
MKKRGIDAFLEARKLAVVGASENNLFSVSLLRNLAAFGFPDGDLYLINPRRKEVLGRTCRPSLSAVPAPIDLAVLLVARERVPEALRSCVEKKIPAALVVASGFAERDARGKELQEETRRLGAAIEIMGPNSMGFVSPAKNLMPWCSPLPDNLRQGNVTAIFHSSGMLNLFLHQCAERGVGIRHGWAPGNEITIGMLDCLRAAVEDEDTRVIALVLEYLGDRKEFARLLDRALECRKPVVVLRLGRSSKTVRAVQAHTGRLGTPSRAWAAFARQKGAILVETLDELIENCVFLSEFAGKSAAIEVGGLGLITISGGDCSLLTDLCERIGLDLPEPSQKTQAAISAAMEKPLTLANPLDVEDLWSAQPESFKEAVRRFAEDPAFGIVACRLNLPKTPGPSFIEMYEGAAAAIRSAGKMAIFLTRASEQLNEEWFKLFSRLSAPFLLEYGKSLGVIKNYLNYVDRLRPARALLRPKSPSETPALKMDFLRLRREGNKVLPHAQAKALFKAYGIRFAPDGIARSEQQAIEVASGIGYPVALKILSPDLPHKTESGAVALGIGSPEELSGAYRKLHGSMQRMNVEIEGVWVQSMVPGGTEVVAGIFQDPLLGPAVLVGLGGIYTEILNDTSIRIPPLSHEEAEAMVRELKGNAILMGARGRPACDVSALADILVALGMAALDFEDLLAAVDLNPVMVLTAGRGAVAVDVLATLKNQ